ncbi:DUF3558 family protein [Streptomyces sp. NPDC048409]|uniref:DUF3558 family protein n=1 Tax=Streptomyces sp. NPDC048409 TaxID=3154723 RepID=UPI00342EEFA7
MRRTLVAVPLLLAVATGCSGQTTPAPTVTVTAPAPGSPHRTTTPSQDADPSATATTTVKACELLPKRDAETLATVPLEDGVESPPSSPGCRYTGPTSGPVAQVEIYLGDGAKKIYDIDRTLDHTFTPVTGAGEEAYQEEDAVFFRKATTWVAIRLVRLNDPEANREPLADLARKVAARL